MHRTLALWRNYLRRHAPWLALACIVATAALLLSRRSLSGRERLILAGSQRPTLGRLYGETVHRSFGKRSAMVSTLGSYATDDPDLLDRAVIHLLHGDLERAIAGFELASRAQPTAQEALTNLSTAYLARFEQRDDCLDLLRAIRAAERGLALRPSDPALLFNRATALSRLGTRLLAERAWQEFERVETDGGWRGEAEARLRELQQPSADAEWESALSRIESPDVQVAEVEAITSRLPVHARVFAEEKLLPRWAASTAAGDAVTAERTLRLAGSIGDALRRLRGEELLFDAVVSIRRTMEAESGAARRATLVRGLQRFGAGTVHFHASNITSARAPLTSAAADLAAAGNPLRDWARFYLALSAYYQDAPRGTALLDDLLGDIPAHRYPALTGRIEWIAGTSAMVQGHVQSSVRRYERSAAALDRAGGGVASAFSNVLLAEALTLLGEHSLAWERRLIAFRRVPLSEGPRRTIAMWTEAKEALVHQGNLALAGPFVEEAVANADQWDKPLGRVVAYLDRAAYRMEIGVRDGALADLRQAQAAIALMEPSAFRDQELYMVLITEGLLSRVSDPARAAKLLREGLERQGATGKRFDAITYTTALADAEIASGDLAAGAASLERALEIFEDIRATVEDPVSRMLAFRQAQPAFDRLIELRTGTLPADREEAFRLAERSRARVLLELRGGGRRTEFARLADVEKSLPSDVTLVSYVVLRDRVLAWVVEDGSARQQVLPTSGRDLEAAIEQFRLELRRAGGVDAIRATAAPLYDQLIRPLGLRPGGGRSLIIIPDRILARLPFAALFNRTAERYLIEERAVAIAASATLLLEGSGHPSVPAETDSTVLIGVSRPGEWRGRNLPALPHAEREVERIAALYPDAMLLQGSMATRGNFLQQSLLSKVIHFAGHAVIDLEA
ncbi:MAG TPA: CHAT domain-containing protein, partial [Thermoanaerobaculia bacterium]|nr:CHAT domain-containing protein [Thermoanaerobaculia bacterium]